MKRVMMEGHLVCGGALPVSWPAVLVPWPPPLVSWPAPLVSWPALCRPSTTLPVSAQPVVDGRAKPGHDTGGTERARNETAIVPRPSCLEMTRRALRRPPRCRLQLRRLHAAHRLRLRAACMEHAPRGRVERAG